jgi:polyisoprenoid-binding protein YceI
MKKISLITGLALLAMTALQAQTIDTLHSVVKFKIKNLKTRTVEGTLTGMQGDIHFNTSDLAGSGFNVCIKAATVNTENKKRDKHLRSEDFFHVEEYPDICFQSSSILESDSGFSTRGLLTLHDVSREIEIPFTYSDKQFTGTLEINRLDYKIGEGTKPFIAAEKVSLEIIAVVD